MSTISVVESRHLAFSKSVACCSSESNSSLKQQPGVARETFSVSKEYSLPKSDAVVTAILYSEHKLYSVCGATMYLRYVQQTETLWCARI